MSSWLIALRPIIQQVVVETIQLMDLWLSTSQLAAIGEGGQMVVSYAFTESDMKWDYSNSNGVRVATLTRV